MMVDRIKAGVGAAQGSPVLAHSPEEFGAYRRPEQAGIARLVR
jgi:hypothetical protein